MFRSGAEKRIVREADRIVSMKEDIDALSWGRVLALGKELQHRHPRGVEADLARELIGIAQSNLSLTSRLGIDSHPAADQVMASGVEMVEGGLAEAALLARHQTPSRDDDGAGDAEVSLPPDSATERTAVRNEGAGGSHGADHAPDAGMRGTVEFDDACDFCPDFDPDEGAAVNQTTLGQGPETHGGLEEGLPGSAQGELSRSAADAMQEPACNQDGGCEKTNLARFCSLYESRDGGLCLFEDDQGHLVAVDASKLA